VKRLTRPIFRHEPYIFTSAVPVSDRDVLLKHWKRYPKYKSI
jgi:hypothetical protein